VLIHIQPLQYSEILAVPFDTTDGDQVEEKKQRLVLPFLLQFEERFDLCSYVRYAASVVQYRHRISVVASIEHLNDVPTYISFHH